jgi:tRNA modification GTPase
VAVVAAAGPAALEVVGVDFSAANGRPLREQPTDRLVFGHWTTAGRQEEVILLRGAEDSLEIHCHGGDAASGRIVADFVAGGCQVLLWSEWLAQGTATLIGVEAEIALAGATTRRAAAILLDQRLGALERAIVNVRALLESGDTTSASAALSTLIDRARLGLRLTEPWRVAIAGPPNVGKSTLINALAGYQRAIVFDQPGTTRDVLAVETAIDGWPVQLTDAAGIRETDNPLEAKGVERAREQLRHADLILWVVDATAAQPDGDAELESLEATDQVSAREPIVVLNKIDLAPGRTPVGDVAVSALTGQGLEQLLTLIGSTLAPVPPQRGEAIPFTVRQAKLLETTAELVNHGRLNEAAHELAAVLSRPAADRHEPSV